MIAPAAESGPAYRRSAAAPVVALSRPSALRVVATAPSRTVRRLIDVVLSVLALVVLAPVLAAIALAVRCTSRGPALFRQVRVGRDGEPFEMLKFRTMYADCDDRLHREYVSNLLADPTAAPTGDGLYKLMDDPRITPVGQRLRRSSLDELPQLINVLRGEMSLVGPRPVLPWEAALFEPRHQARFRVRPGMTGLWQTSGRNTLTMTQALDLDVRYVEQRSLALDLKILVRTVPVVLGRDGVR